MEGEEPTSIATRLQSVKQAVRKATEEAVKSASSQDALLGEPQFGENQDPNLTSSDSFALGMTLFGQDMVVIEKAIQEKLTKMEAELKDVVVTLEEQSSSPAAEPVQSPKALQAQAKQLTKRIQFLQICSAARASLDQATTTITEPDFMKAAERLEEAKSSLGKAQDMVKAEESATSEPTNALYGAYRILDSIRTAIRRKKLDLVSKATDLVESSITITSNSISVKTKVSSNPQAVQGLRAAYDIIEKLSPSSSNLLKSIRLVTNKLVTLIIQPILADIKNGTTTTKWAFMDASSRNVTGLEWTQEVAETSDSSSIQAWKHAFAFLERIVAFFQANVLLDRDSLCANVGERLFGSTTIIGGTSSMRALGFESNLLGVHSAGIMQELVDALKLTCIPEFLPPNELGSLKETATAIETMTDSFDEEMKRLKLYPFDSQKPTPFANLVSNFCQLYIDKRRTTILAQARTILIDNDYHNTVNIGEEISKQESHRRDGTMQDEPMAVFKLHKSCVSQTATMIMNLCRKTMEEATTVVGGKDDNSFSLLPPTLYRTAREILDLFRLIVPNTFEREVSNVPRTAAVLHNDCVYFSHHCLTLGLEYKEKFLPGNEDDVRGQTLRQTCVFVDMVPIFRELADKAMGDMLEKQHGQISEIVGTRITLLGESLKSNESLAEWVDAETAIKAGIYHVQHLSQAWRPVLSKAVFQRSVGFLMDGVFNLYLGQMFAASAISEPASQFVGSIFRLGMQGAVDILSNDLQGCLSWDRFSSVGRFMDMSLVDINVALSEGVFRSITGPELSRLITATFDDSEKRRNLLQALRASEV